MARKAKKVSVPKCTLNTALNTLSRTTPAPWLSCQDTELYKLYDETAWPPFEYFFLCSSPVQHTAIFGTPSTSCKQLLHQHPLPMDAWTVIRKDMNGFQPLAGKQRNNVFAYVRRIGECMFK